MQQVVQDINLDCTIVIVSFNSRDLTDTCLTKAEKAAAYSHTTLHNNTEIIVVDNASTDGTVEMIRKKHPSIHLLPQKENLRFGKGNNIAFAKAKTPFIIMLNSDAFLEEETLAKLLTHMKENPNYDALCCQLIFPDGSFQRTGGYLPTPLKTVLWSFGIDSIPLLTKMLHPIYNRNQSFYTKDRKIGWCQGSFMLFKQEVYKKTGGFDEKIYFYMEDIEWCKRIKDAGYHLYFTPTISLIHLAGGSSKNLLQLERLKNGCKGMLYFMSKHYPRSQNIIKECITLGMFLRMFFYFMIGQQKNAVIYKELANYLRTL